MATIEDVAREAGVAISTVSYALSGKRKLSPETRERVLAAAAKLGYAPNSSARALAGKRSRIIAVTAPRHEDTDPTAHMVFAMAVTLAARARGYDTLLLVDKDPLEGMRRIAETALADGVIVLDVAAHDPRAALARQLRVPTVFIGLPDNPDDLVCVDLDFDAAVGAAVDTLADHGHERVGLIGQPDAVLAREPNYTLRIERAFVSHARHRKLATAIVRPTSGDAGPVVDELLAQLPGVTGIVLATVNDVATSLTTALSARGLTVPGDVSVIAAGMTPLPGTHVLPFDAYPLEPGLTCPVAVDLLIDLIERNPRPPEVTLVAPSRIERGSVARAATLSP